MSNNKVISVFSIGNLQLCLRKRISINQLFFPDKETYYNNIDLAVIFKYYKKNKYPLLAYKEKWDNLFFNLICFEIFNLLNSNKIILHHYIDKKYIIHPLFSFKIRGYIFEVKNENFLKSNLSRNLIVSIKNNQHNKNKKRYLNKIITGVFNEYLTPNKEYKTPTNEFINRYLKTNTNFNSNYKVTPIKQSYFHQSFFEFTIEKKFQQQLNNNFNITGSKLLYLKKSNLEFREFLIKFESIINQEITNKEPDTSGD